MNATDLSVLNGEVANYFTRLSAIDCSQYVEKKGKFSYLSWSFAVSELLKKHPDATWRVIDDTRGWPFWQTDCGYFVKVGVTVNGIERIQCHPVLDNNNRPISSPNSFQINTSIQRGLVKAIALHGLGLYIYAGEDLPNSASEDPTSGVVEPAVDAARVSYDDNAKVRHDRALAKHKGSLDLIKQHIENFDNDGDTAHLYSMDEAWSEIPRDDQIDLWLAPTKGGYMTTHERDVIKNKEAATTKRNK